MKKYNYNYTVEGTDGKVYGFGSTASANKATAEELVNNHNGIDGLVYDVEQDANGHGLSYICQVNNSDEFFVDFEAI